MPMQVTKRQSLYFRPHSNHVSNKRLLQTETSTCIEEEASLAPKLSLFDALPVELQVEIFFQCLSSFPTFSIDEAPLSIARVCHRWNYLVFNTPKLWSAFEIKMNGPSTSRSSACIKSTNSKVKQWLLRSKQCLLSIKVTPNLAGRFCDPRSTLLLALLGSEAHRWRHIEFSVPSMDYLAIQHILTDNLPALQSVVLRLTGLSKLLPPKLDLSLRHLPWRQITHIDLQPEDPNLINLDMCLDILSQTDPLKECTFKLDYTMDLLNIRQHHGNTVLLPLLNKLTLNLHGGIRTRAESPEACLAQFLNIISVPRLRTLHLGWFGPQNQGSDLWTAHHPEFLSFFRSIAETLRSFSIAYLPFSEKDLRQCFSYLKNLTHLALKYPLSDAYDDPVTSSFLSSCTFPAAVFDFDAKDAKDDTPPTDSPLLSMLEICEIAGHGRGYTSARLIAFIESRSKGALRQDSDTQLGVMKSCRIFSTNVIYDEMEDYVRRWKDSGMEISIESLVIR